MCSASSVSWLSLRDTSSTVLLGSFCLVGLVVSWWKAPGPQDYNHWMGNLILTYLELWIFKIGATVQKLRHFKKWCPFTDLFPLCRQHISKCPFRQSQISKTKPRSPTWQMEALVTNLWKQIYENWIPLWPSLEGLGETQRLHRTGHIEWYSTLIKDTFYLFYKSLKIKKSIKNK